MVIPGSGTAAMRFYNFAIVIEKEPEENSPGPHGCFSNGRTIEKAKPTQHARGNPAARRVAARASRRCRKSPELRR
jgi:hypothetical protein